MLPKHWWEGTDASGKKRDIARDHAGAAARQRRLPHQGIQSPAAPSCYERVKDYWGKDLNVNIGRDNFDEIRYEYFRDATVALEAFKADLLDWRTENSREELGDRLRLPGREGQARRAGGIPDPLQRRDAGLRLQYPARQVQGPARAPRHELRVRFRGDEQADLLRPVQAHRELFRGTRARLDRACREGKELEILETVRDKVPPEVFTKPYTNPVGGTPENVRANLREALRLLKEAGYEVRNQKLVNAKTGEPFSIEFLVSAAIRTASASSVLQALARAARHDGHRSAPSTTRSIVNRERNWDFDVIIDGLGPVALARQRAARLLGLAGGGSGRLAQSASASRTRRSMR